MRLPIVGGKPHTGQSIFRRAFVGRGEGGHLTCQHSGTYFVAYVNLYLTAGLLHLYRPVPYNRCIYTCTDLSLTAGVYKRI